MSDKKIKNLSTEPYKGVRDFYPEDMYVENYLFDVMKKTVASFGYEEYGASILEPTELYKAKSGEEIVNEQTYSFKDRGDRDVTLRPEMTPTVTRMVAARKRDLTFPLRWFSIPNLFRYEKPQRGRLREHYQLNVDLFGVESFNAEAEIISIASEILHAFGATSHMFKIRINNRKILTYLLTEILKLSGPDSIKVTKIIDKKEKLPADEFRKQIYEYTGKKTDIFIELLSSKDVRQFAEIIAEKFSSEAQGVKETEKLLKDLESLNVTNAVFDPSLARGFDYYTGIVFEVFDTNPENPRALFGGGRFDDLLSVFGSEKVPAVGFGMGDVTIRDFLETHSLLPAVSSKTQLALCVVDSSLADKAMGLAQTLRKKGLYVAVDLSNKKVGQQIQAASSRKIPFVLVMGEDEVRNKKYKIKELANGNETEAKNEDDISRIIISKTED